MRLPAITVLALLAAGAATAQPFETVPLDEVGHVHGIALDPDDPDRVYLATHYGLHVARPDGLADRISKVDHDFMGFSAHPERAGKFFASGHPQTGGNLGVVVSRDGGVSWDHLSDGAGGPVDFHAMTVSQADPDVLYGAYRGLQVSRDGGVSWEMVGPQPPGLIALAASAADPETVYAATEVGLLVSRDGGRSWQAAHLLQHPVTAVAISPDGAVYAWMYGHGLLAGREPDLRLERRAEAEDESYLLHLAIDPSDGTRLFAIDGAGSLVHSIDEGRTWEPYPR